MNLNNFFPRARHLFSRRRALHSFYSRLISPGDLCFDIGAHVGAKTDIYLRLEARVVCVEPRGDSVAELEKKFARDPNVSIIHAAVAAAPGSVVIRHNPKYKELSTLSNEWIERMSRQAGESIGSWSESEEVEATTLDLLIERFSAPSFLKLDIEGAEAIALRGLTHPVPVIAFEAMPFLVDEACEAVAELRRIGGYAFNYTFDEVEGFEASTWMSDLEIERELLSLSSRTMHGIDLFALRAGFRPEIVDGR